MKDRISDGAKITMTSDEAIEVIDDASREDICGAKLGASCENDKELVYEVIDNPEQDDEIVLEMANILWEDHPEMPANVYISPKQGNHGPRIKVQLNHDGAVENHNMAPITISDKPLFKGKSRGQLNDSELNYFYNWIRQNKDVLMAYWNGNMQIERVLRSLQY